MEILTLVSKLRSDGDLEPVLKSKERSQSAVDLSIHSDPYSRVGVGSPNLLGLETKPLRLI